MRSAACCYFHGLIRRCGGIYPPSLVRDTRRCEVTLPKAERDKCDESRSSQLAWTALVALFTPLSPLPSPCPARPGGYKQETLRRLPCSFDRTSSFCSNWCIVVEKFTPAIVCILVNTQPRLCNLLCRFYYVVKTINIRGDSFATILKLL